MRGWLSQEVLEIVGRRYRHSEELKENFSRVIFPLSANDEHVREAQIRLEDGWRLLDESRYALFEAEAHRLWYEKFRDPPIPVTAAFFRRYYVDDASLRLYSSGEYLFKAVRSFWRIPKGTEGDYLLEKVILAARQMDPIPPFVSALERLDEDRAWKESSRHRDDWVHNRLCRVEGVDTAKRLSVAPFRSSDAVGFTIGVWPLELKRIEDVQRNAEHAYSILFSTYESILRLIEQEIDSHLGADAFSRL